MGHRALEPRLEDDGDKEGELPGRSPSFLYPFCRVVEAVAGDMSKTILPGKVGAQRSCPIFFLHLCLPSYLPVNLQLKVAFKYTFPCKKILLFFIAIQYTRMH